MTKTERLELIRNLVKAGNVETVSQAAEMAVAVVEPTIAAIEKPIAENPVAETAPEAPAEEEIVFDPSLDSVEDATGLIALLAEVERDIERYEKGFKISEEDWDDMEGNRQAKMREAEEIKKQIEIRG